MDCIGVGIYRGWGGLKRIKWWARPTGKEKGAVSQLDSNDLDMDCG
jgi:hypothetical protein